MHIKELHLTNIGPFNDAHLEFAADDAPRVTIITGENGTGKTIVLDAIRGLFGQHYANLERNIIRAKQPFDASMVLNFLGRVETVRAASAEKRFMPQVDLLDFQIAFVTHLPHFENYKLQETPDFIVDYWRSALQITNESYDDSVEIPTFGLPIQYAPPNPSNYLKGSLEGFHTTQETNKYIYFFDTLRDSRDPQEKQIGEVIYPILEKIVKFSLMEGGKLKFVRRSELMPIIEQNGMEVPLSNLSSGNLYMIQRLVSLLGKMYAVHILRQTPPETLCDTPGLLLIDEAENHLHPKWQKRFIPTILDIFPNLQIIATTHSPFIVSSVKGAKVYVCKPHTDHCTIEDETDYYVNKPVEEILASPVFDTSPFSKDISELLEQRREAIQSNNEQQRKEIETALKAQNPQYFSYLDIDEVLHSIAAATP